MQNWKKFAVISILLCSTSSLSHAEGEAASPPSSMPAEQAVTPPASAVDLVVQEAKFATSVQDREPLGANETNTFPSDTARLYLWTVMTGAQEPVEIKHVWYWNSEKIAEVPLTLRYPRMRTWSYKSLPMKAGSVKVEIQDLSGRVLKEVSATLSETQAAPSAPPAEEKPAQ